MPVYVFRVFARVCVCVCVRVLKSMYVQGVEHMLYVRCAMYVQGHI